MWLWMPVCVPTSCASLSKTIPLAVSLGFLIWKLGFTVDLYHWGCCKLKGDDRYKALCMLFQIHTVLNTQGYYIFPHLHPHCPPWLRALPLSPGLLPLGWRPAHPPLWLPEEFSHHEHWSMWWIGLLVPILTPLYQDDATTPLPCDFAGPPTADGVCFTTPLIF